jgi:hypothetical protein
MRSSRFDFATVDVGVVSDGERRSARLYRPDRPRRPPVVVAAPGALPASVALPAYAERFATAGWAVLVTEGGDRLDPAARLADWRAAVAAVRDRDDVRGRKPALFGVGLAGGLALALADEDPRIRGVLAHDPVVDGGALLAARSGRDRLRALGTAVRDRVGARLGRGATVPVHSDADGRAAFVGDDAGDLARLAPEGWANETPARTLLSLRRFAASLRDADAPALLVGSRDGDYAPGRVSDVAEQLRRPTTVELPASHGEFYRRPERVAGYDVAFLSALE